MAHDDERSDMQQALEQEGHKFVLPETVTKGTITLERESSRGKIDTMDNAKVEVKSYRTEPGFIIVIRGKRRADDVFLEGVDVTKIEENEDGSVTIKHKESIYRLRPKRGAVHKIEKDVHGTTEELFEAGI